MSAAKWSSKQHKHVWGGKYLSLTVVIGYRERLASFPHQTVQVEVSLFLHTRLSLRRHHKSITTSSKTHDLIRRDLRAKRLAALMAQGSRFWHFGMLFCLKRRIIGSDVPDVKDFGLLFSLWSNNKERELQELDRKGNMLRSISSTTLQSSIDGLIISKMSSEMIPTISLVLCEQI